MLSAARAPTPGAQAASAPTVVFCENHCSRDRWATALREADSGDWAATGPQFVPAQPGGRAETIPLLNYADFVGPCSRR
jgi:hypothetical protein